MLFIMLFRSISYQLCDADFFYFLKVANDLFQAPRHCFQLALISDQAQDQCQLFLIRRNGPQKLFNNGMQQLKLRSCKMNSPSVLRTKRLPPSPSLMHGGKEKLPNPLLLELLASCLHLEVFVFVHHSPFHWCKFYIRPQFFLYCCCCFSAQGNSSHQQKPSASSGKPMSVYECDFVPKLTDSVFLTFQVEKSTLYTLNFHLPFMKICPKRTIR